jgi:hypothetical protein
MAQLFHVGDRVQSIRQIEGILIGSSGTIVRMLVVSGYCDVQFEGYVAPRLVYHSHLALVERKSTDGQS